VVGLGRIADLMLLYFARDDIEIVAACDRDPERLDGWRPAQGDAALSVDAAEIVGLHMEIVNTGRGGWDVLPQSWEWQLDQTRDARSRRSRCTATARHASTTSGARRRSRTSTPTRPNRSSGALIGALDSARLGHPVVIDAG
jgi:hypothetical protein